jgi:hypothetical protein
MRINLGRVRVYPWHSINLFPQIGTISICKDDPPYEWDHTMVELVVLGYVMHIDLPWKLTNMGTKLRGPIWSKRKKKWYRAPK